MCWKKRKSYKVKLKYINEEQSFPLKLAFGVKISLNSHAGEYVQASLRPFMRDMPSIFLLKK